MENITSRAQSSRPSVGFAETVETVRAQIEIECVGDFRAQAEEMALIVAEVYRLPSETPMRIAGRQIRAEDVAEVYSRLTAEHIRYVIGRFNAIDHEIQNKKSYIRTALYNAVFEMEAALANRATIALRGWK